MISKEFIEYLSDKTKVERKELIEKDLILQQLLKELEKDNYFNHNFVFKGGTCIIKCYLDYYRFSEDLDFTWINQEIFKQKSEKQIRKLLTQEINKLAEFLQTTSQELSLDFIQDKKNKRYFEFGGSNKFVTFKLWYKSQILNIEQFIKIQINFVELIKYEFRICLARTLFSQLDFKEIEFLFPKESEIIQKTLKINTYNIEEILVEKFRAILTRQTLKSRDFIDIYFIIKHLKKDFRKYKKDIIEKTIFMLKYEKYSANIQEKEELLKKFELKDEENILLKKPEKEFKIFIKELPQFLNELIIDLKKTKHL